MKLNESYRIGYKGKNVANVEEEKIAIEKAKGKSDIKAFQAIKGCSYDVAHKHASQYFKEHPQIRVRAIDIVRETAGLTLEDALQEVKEGLQATYPDKSGKMIPDHIARHEHCKTLLRLHRELGDTDTLPLIQSNTINYINNIDVTTLRDLIAQVKGMRASMNEITDGEIVG